MDEACELPILSKMCQSIGDQTVQLITAPFDWLAHVLAQTAAVLFTTMWSAMDSTTLVDLTKPGYLSIYNLVFGLAVVLMLIFFCLQLLTGLIRRDPSALSRAVVGLGKSVLGSFVVVGLTATLLEITDQLSVGIVQATGQTMAGMGDRAAGLTEAIAGLAFADPGAGLILTIILAGLAIAAALAVWFSLLIRKALLLVAIIFAPVAFAGLTWDTTRAWFGRWASFVIALCCSKLVLVVVFLVAVNRTDVPIDKGLQSVSDPIAGIALLLVAAFAPYLAYKFISFIGFDIGHAVGSEQEAKAALAHPMPVPVMSPLASRARSILVGSKAATAGAEGASRGPSAPSGQAPTRPGAGGGPAAASSATAPAAAGRGAAAGGAAAAGGPAGVGVMAAAKAVSAGAGIGPKVGRQMAANASDQTASAAGQSHLSAPRASGAAGSRTVSGRSNPWLSQHPQVPAVAEPPPPEPMPPKPPQT